MNKDNITLKDLTFERLIEILPEDLYRELVTRVDEKESYVLVVRKDIYSVQYPEIIKHYLIPTNLFNKHFDVSDKRCFPKDRYYNDWDKYSFGIEIDKPIVKCYIYAAGV